VRKTYREKRIGIQPALNFLLVIILSNLKVDLLWRKKDRFLELVHVPKIGHLFCSLTGLSRERFLLPAPAASGEAKPMIPVDL
jgi:hypothetical protein